MSRWLIWGVVGAVSLLAAPAHADLVTFNSASGVFVPPATLSTEGFTFTPTAVSNSFISINNQSDIVGDGTKNLFVANHTELNMRADDSSPFNLIQFEIGGSWINSPNRWADGVDVIGNLSGGGTVSTTVYIPNSPASLQTFVLPGTFVDLASVDFEPFNTSGGGVNDFEFVLENIETSSGSVPEPAALALAALALGYHLRRRRHTA